MQCFLCKRNDFELQYSLPKKDIFRCKNDGLFVAGSRYDGLLPYGNEYFSNAPNLSNESYFSAKLKKIQKMTGKKKPNILDIGCGWGDFEEVLEKEKIPYLGIDVNQEAIEICRKKGLRCKQINIVGTSRDLPLLKDKFDAVTMFQVIEHLKNPLPHLESAKKLLNPSGIILITTPNNNSPLRNLLGPYWTVYSEPSHYVFYNKTTLSQTLEKAEFKNSEVNNDSWRFLSLRYILNRLHIPKLNLLHLTSKIALPTDPFGDIEATALSPNR